MSHHVHEDVAQANLVKDPVCGMDVDPDGTRAPAEHDGQTYYFCSAHCQAKFEADPELRICSQHEQPGRRARSPAGGGRVDLPDAPGDPAPGPGLVPDLRDGAGTGDGHRGHRPEPGAGAT